MRLNIRDGLPFISVTLVYREKTILLGNVLLDTGSAGSIFSIDRLAEVGIAFEANDPVHRIIGVGGAEFVFLKRVDNLRIGETQDALARSDYEIEVGLMDYGLPLEGIVGMDFLLSVGAVIDLRHASIYRFEN